LPHRRRSPRAWRRASDRAASATSFGEAPSAETAVSRALSKEAASPSTGTDVRGWAAKERVGLDGVGSGEAAAARARGRAAMRAAGAAADDAAAADDDEEAAAAAVRVWVGERGVGEGVGVSQSGIGMGVEVGGKVEKRGIVRFRCPRLRERVVRPLLFLLLRLSRPPPWPGLLLARSQLE
jgi:hypothetical protein